MRVLPIGILGTITSIALVLGHLSPSPGGEKNQNEKPKTGKWAPLFNGKNLQGWDTWLGKPHQGNAIVGLNKDPQKVYSVVTSDGQPVIRISGEVFGAITTVQDFENYHLKLEFKWGEKRWPPREKAVRDSGLLYHCIGPHGAMASFWMQSQELQIQEHDCGDYWSVAGAIVDVEAEPKGEKGPLVYKKGGETFTVPHEKYGPRIVKSADYERPTREWNSIELPTVGQTSVHLINGKVNMVLHKSRHKAQGRDFPLTRGKIQLQSEGAEVFYRNIYYRPLEKIPEKYLE